MDFIFLYIKPHLKMMRHYCFLLIAFLNSASVFAQSAIEKYVRNNTVRIAAIEPDSTGYSDLAAFSDAIGNDSLIMLGEEDHGDAPTFLAKTRLVKYLHERKGFNVLAFEGDFFALNEGWDNLVKIQPEIRRFIFNDLFGVWTMCDACSNLFYDYIPGTYQTKQPLMVSGFDCQQYEAYSVAHLKSALDSLIHAKNLPIANRPGYTSKIWPLIAASLQPHRQPPVPESIDSCLKYLAVVKAELSSATSKEDFWVMVLDNCMEQMATLKGDLQTGINSRDIQMAKNLKWLVENKYKGQKIIVWAADRHIARSLKNGDDTLKTEETMGDWLVKSLAAGKRVYILGFTSYEGEAGRLGRDGYKVPEPAANVFESWVHAKGYPYAFIDFAAYNIRHPGNNEKFLMAPLGHTPNKNSWNLVFDGVFYIKDMYRCVQIDHRPY
jgi:erythromycin esterase